VMHLTLNLLLQAAAVTAGGQDYAAAYKQADAGRPLVVLVGADWCPGCRQMKYAAMPEVEKMGGLQKVAFAYVNTERDSDLAGKLMKGGSIPQLIVYRKTVLGWQRQQMTGAHSAGAIKNFIDQASEAPVAELSSRD